MNIIRETKKKKDEIGPRIDECRKGLADINLAAVDDARIDVKMVPGQIEALRKKKLEESSMDQSVKDRERLAEVNAKILELALFPGAALVGVVLLFAGLGEQARRRRFSFELFGAAL